MLYKTILAVLLRRRSALLRNDRGIALPMVLLVFLVGVALISAFLVAITGSAQVTATSRDTLRAQAAAEAGIADVLAQIADPATALCSLASAPRTDPTGAVAYSVKVDFGTPASFTVPASWNTTCPTQNTLLRIVSTGTVAGAKQSIERIHKIVSTPPTTDAFDDVILSDGAWSFAGNTKFDLADAARPADVIIRKGDFNCTASGTILGSVYVKEGNANLSGACKIRDNLEVSGNLVIGGSGKVKGNAIISGTVKISGDAYAIDGTLTHGGALTLQSGLTKATAVRGAVNQTPVTLSAAPAWRDLSLSSFVAAGFEKVTWSGGCTASYSPVHEMVAKVATYTRPTVIDATACATLKIESNDVFKLGSDVAIVAPKIHLRAFTFNSTSSAKRNLYVVSSNVTPSCPSTRVDVFTDMVKFTDGKVSGLIYANCRAEMENSGAYWRGSVYTKNLIGTPLLTFAPVADPKEVGGAGGGGGAAGKLTLDVTPVSVRNINSAP